MTLSIDLKKYLTKLIPIHDKKESFKKLGIERKIFNLIKNIYVKLNIFLLVK